MTGVSLWHLKLMKNLADSLKESLSRAEEHSDGCLYCGGDEEYVRETGESSKEHQQVCWFFIAVERLAEFDSIGLNFEDKTEGE